MSPKDTAVLLDMYNLTPEEGWALYFQTLVTETRPKKEVRVRVRRLARKGLVEYVTGLVDDDGMLAGSGYALTRLGRDVAEAIMASRGITWISSDGKVTKDPPKDGWFPWKKDKP